MGASGDEADSRYTVVHQLAGQLAAGHALIAYGEVESVGNRLVEITVIDDVEAVAKEDFLQLVGAVTIYLYLLAEVVCSVTGCFQHGRHSILGRMACAAAEGIEHTGREHQSEGQSLVAGREVGIVAVEQLVRDAGYTNALSGIAKGLRP